MGGGEGKEGKREGKGWWLGRGGRGGDEGGVVGVMAR